MNALSKLTAPLDADTRAMVDRLAVKRGMSSADYAAEAIRRESDADFDAFRQVGIDAADRGDMVPHEQVMAELDAMIEKHRARCRE